MPEAVYPLAQVLQVKERRVEEAEKVVKEKLLALEKEQKILKEKEAVRDKAKDHYNAKLKQMREEMDHGTTSHKIQQMKAYLKIALERINAEEKRVKDQKVQVENAEKNLENARQELRIKRQEVDKFVNHRQDWRKEMLKEQEIIDAREQDELGSIIFSTQQRTRKYKE